MISMKDEIELLEADKLKLWADVDQLQQENKKLKEQAQEYGEFTLRCNGSKMKLLSFEGYLKMIEYCDNKLLNKQ